jgi:hypothetical protein
LIRTKQKKKRETKPIDKSHNHKIDDFMKFDSHKTSTKKKTAKFSHSLLFPAMVVRYITKRFIGEYDPNLEKTYTHNTTVDNEDVFFEILDGAKQSNVRIHFVGS